MYALRQNNSGGSFHGPAAMVLIEANSADNALELAKMHIDFCGDSGRYADYDNCGCCPCCGHRWSEYLDDVSDDYFIGPEFKEYMGTIHLALIKSNGELLIGDTDENFQTIRNFHNAATNEPLKANKALL